jgi:phenylalanyl-tRNA synthetase beta chain
VLAGPRPAYLEATDDVNVYDAKGLACELVERLTGQELTVEALGATCPYLHPRSAARLIVQGTEVGAFGALHPDVVDLLDLDGPAVVVELDLAALERLPSFTPRYRPIPRLPAVSRDIAVLVGPDVEAAVVERAIQRAAGDLCETVELFDVFEGQGIPKDHRSLAYRVVYRDPNASKEPEKARTLTDKEVDDRQSRVQKAVEELGRVRA